MSALHVNAAPSAPLDAMQVAALAEYCLGATGPARVRLIGQEVGDLAAPLRSAGCQVIEASCGEALTPDDGVVIAWAHDNDARAGILRLDVTVAMLVGPAQAASEASAWLVQASVSGWDLHPAVFAMMEVPEGLQVLMFTRRGVDAALENDAQCASFHGLAAALVRPGDVVLATDAAQGGLWRIVWQQSRCAWLGLLTDQPPPTGLEHGVHWLDEQAWRDSPTPLDVVITRLPHGSSDWAHGLRRASSALIRSGRLVIQVPLESGHIVHDGSLLALLEECGLVVDRAWWQIRSVPHGLRQFTEVERDDHERLAIEAGLSDAADAWVLLAVKTEGRGVVQVPDLDAPNIIAFQRDYLDASVVRLIVAIGLRLESAVLRRDLARRTMQEVPEASADYGAALCVLLYDPVTLSGGGREELIAAAHRYIVLPAINPTMLRWQVSLAFAVAGLQQSSGDLLQAAALYEQVLGFDVLAFSALLGTKTTTAAARLGWIRFGAGDVAGARQAWARGLEEARRLSLHTAWSEVIGDPDAPETFAMPEFAAVMDEAGCLASALRVTAESPLRPGTAWQWANRSWRMQLETARLMQLSRQRWHDQLQDAKDWLDGQYHQLTAELERHKAAVHVLESDKHVLEAEMTGLRAAFGLAHRHAASQLAKQTRAIQALESEQRVSVVEMNGLRAAFELAHRRAAAEKVALQQQLHDAQADYVQLSAAHSQLQSAARNLTAATGAILHTVPQTRLPAESIAEEMSRLAAALNRLPLKRLVWAALRGLASLLGRR